MTVAGVATAAGLCWPAAVAVLGRRRRTPVLLGWLLAAQVITHVVLDSLCTEVTSGQVRLVDQLTKAPDPTMLVLHAAAVVVSAVLLGRADAGLWMARSLFRTSARLLAVLSLRPTDAPVVVVRPRVSPALLIVVPPDLWKAPRPARRGPPALPAR